MAQILDPLPPDNKDHILCCYVNATNHIQIARITNIANWYFERVVFPGQRLVFEAMTESLLEIHTGMMASSILSDRIPCDRLCVDEEIKSRAKPIPEPQAENKVNKPNIETVNQPSRITLDSLAGAAFG
jgi:Domain of unknown function (DUF1830)